MIILIPLYNQKLFIDSFVCELFLSEFLHLTFGAISFQNRPY
jgi:hypothetical protein